MVLSRNPNATIGNTLRSFQKREKSGERLLSPGPSDYTINRNLAGPKYLMGVKLDKSNENPTPGPQDYKFNPVNFLKKESRATMGKAKRESVLDSR